MGMDVGKICHCRHKGGRSQGHWNQGELGGGWVVVWWCKSWGQLIVASKTRDKCMEPIPSSKEGIRCLCLDYDLIFEKEHELRQGMWGPTESIQWAAFQGKCCFGTRTKLTSSAKYSEMKAPAPGPPKSCEPSEQELYFPIWTRDGSFPEN